MQDSEKDELIRQLLEQRDQMYREIRLREERISELESHADKKLLSQKDAELAAKDKDLARKDKTIREQEDKILKLESSIAWLKRKMWGKMSEKHIPEDPNQRLIEWEGLELLPEEQEAVKSAEKEIDEMRQRQESVAQRLPGSRNPYASLCRKTFHTRTLTSIQKAITKRNGPFLASQKHPSIWSLPQAHSW